LSDSIPQLYLTAERLEQYLGDPLDEWSVSSFERSLKYDVREEFPEGDSRPGHG
jgi:hypothetical protein